MSYLFIACQLLEWASSGVGQGYERYAFHVMQLMDFLYFFYYLKLGYKPPLLGYGGRFMLMSAYGWSTFKG